MQNNWSSLLELLKANDWCLTLTAISAGHVGSYCSFKFYYENNQLFFDARTRILPSLVDTVSCALRTNHMKGELLHCNASTTHPLLEDTILTALCTTRTVTNLRNGFMNKGTVSFVKLQNLCSKQPAQKTVYKHKLQLTPSPDQPLSPDQRAHANLMCTLFSLQRYLFFKSNWNFKLFLSSLFWELFLTVRGTGEIVRAPWNP